MDARARRAGSRLSAPANHFNLVLGRPEYLLLAGGIGVTPIFTHALALAEASARFRLIYACRSRGDLALAKELAERLGDRLELFLSEEGRRVDIAAEIARLDPQGEFYVCGPIGMLEAAKRRWRESGRPVDRLRFETFGNSGAHPSVPFVIKIPRLGKEIAVDANQTMLEALEDANVGMIFDCRRGECGLCALPILAVDGVVDHRDVFFSDAEKAQNLKLCTCVSRVLRRIDHRRHGGPMKRELAFAWTSNLMAPEASVAIYTPALEPAILWVRALDLRTDIFGCRFSIQAATALPFS